MRNASVVLANRAVWRNQLFSLNYPISLEIKLMKSTTTTLPRQKCWSIASSIVLSCVIAGCGGGGSSAPPEPATYSVGGNVNGLASGRSVVLQNGSGDGLTVSANGSFVFATKVTSGTNYAVSVKTQPVGQTCVASDSQGVVSANVSSIVVACSSQPVLKALSIVPTEIRYSQSTDQLVMTTDSANVLHIVDPNTGTDRTIDLLAQPKRLQLSPDGKLAAVLYGSVVDLIDVATAKRIRSSLLNSVRSDVLLFNSGEAYLLGGDQWSGTPGFINARTGEVSTPSVQYAAGTYWGYGQYGLVADKIDSLVTISTGLSPSKLTKLTYDPTSPIKPISSGDWPYHGAYSGSVPIGFNAKQSLVFTQSGLVAYTSSMKFAAYVNVSKSLRSVSASADDTELLVVQADSAQPDRYSAQYDVIDPTLLLVRSSVPFPQIEGGKSYGGAVFHTVQQRRVAVLRSGDATQPARAKMWTYVF
ncbi:hypothetical protein GTP41_22845 [Pseudoduganella sp. DS3]|uniref:Uncharacterized protein n=1 Tax=Pseudoduganella guangdongensis TaxID=2692179 RepID=A0A6N9HNS6_9BURK|nr:hypothetical protein [Pseudoduganella guangdongensis]MYN04937.1 hypothetical protein [Pseudoduganella guangdongensis]